MIVLKEADNEDLVSLYEGFLTDWIPAFAGMTNQYFANFLVSDPPLNQRVQR